MNQRPRAPRKSTIEDGGDPPTIHAAVAEGREPILDIESAQAIADASSAAGFPPPPTVAAALDLPIEVSAPTVEPASSPADGPVDGPVPETAQ